MKKKVLYGVTLALLGGASMVSLQSCKDDLSDFEHRYDYNKSLTDQELIDLWNFCKDGDNSLDKRIDALEKFRKQLMGMDPNAEGISQDVKDFLNTWRNYDNDIIGLSEALWGEDYENSKTGGLTGKVNGIWDEIYKDQEGKPGLKTLVTTLNSTVGNLKSIVEGEKGNEALWALIHDANTGNEALDAKIKTLNELINGGEGVVGIETKIDDINELLYGKEGQPGTGIIEQIADIYSKLGDKLDKSDFNSFKTEYDSFKAAFDNLNENIIPAIQADIKDVQDRMKVVEDSVAELRNRVANVEAKVEALLKRIDSLITGILVQRAFGPVFGDFSLPMGVQSNLLFGWYGENTQGIFEFPTVDTAETGLESDLFNGFKIDSNISTVYDGDIDLGRLFLTINPAGHNFTDTKLSLEKSNGDKLEAIKVVPVKSDYLLTFGSSRAQSQVEGNGLYEAKMSIAYDKRADIEVSINKDDMKDAVKGVLNDPSTASAAKLLKVVYDQVNKNLQSMPAYAVCYQWSTSGDVNKTEQLVYGEDGKPLYNNDGSLQTVTVETREPKDYSVRSKYEIGVATAHPLSYNTLSDEGSSKTVPTVDNLHNYLDRLEEKINNKLNVNATTDVKGNTVAIERISINEDPNKPNHLLATIYGLQINGQYPVIGRFLSADVAWMSGKGEFKVPCGDKPEEAVGYINNAIKEILYEVVGREKVNDAFKAEADLKIDAVLLQVNQQINKIINELKANVTSSFESVSNSDYFSRVNKLFDLYNKIANKINKFLANPNAALQVVAFYDAKGGIERLSQKKESPTVVEGTGKMKVYLTNYTGEFIVPACKKFFGIKDEAGKVVFQTVVDGSETEVVFDVPTNTGIYQAVYQGLDYSGYTSTKKFYIEVK